MKPDGAERLDPIERAHLREPGDTSHAIYRVAAPDDLTDLVRRFWLPVWSVPPGEEAEQQVLQYPVALAVVASVHEAMDRDPHDETAHRRVVDALAELARHVGPADDEGRAANPPAGVRRSAGSGSWYG